MHPKLVFDTSKDIILENERVLLRPLVQEDAVYLSAYVKEEPTLWQYALTPITTEQEFDQYIKTAIESRHLKTAYPLLYLINCKINMWVAQDFMTCNWKIVLHSLVIPGIAKKPGGQV